MQTAVIKNNKSGSSLVNLNSLLEELATQVTGSTIEFPSHFNFIWQDILFAGQVLHRPEQNKYAISLVAELGYVPFSAEDINRRQELLIALEPLLRKGDISLSQSSQIQMIQHTEFTGPANAKKLMEVITLTILDLQDKLKSIFTIIS